MRTSLAVFALSALLLPGVAFAANFSVFPASINLNQGDSVTFLVRVNSADSINTIGTALLLPQGLTFLSASDGPVLKDWIEHPTYHADTRSISFSGIVPNGWSGEDTLVSIKVAARVKGSYALTFDPAQTEAYKNDGHATQEPVVFGTASIKPLTPPFIFGTLVVLAVLYLIYRIIRRKIKIRLV